jgi:hypothetical protein
MSKLIKGGIGMRQIIRAFLGGAAGLTAIMLMASTVQVEAAPTGDQWSCKPGGGSVYDGRYGLTLPTASTPESQPIFLAQNTSTKKEQSPGAPPTPPAEKSLRTMSPAPPPIKRMEEKAGKGLTINDEPERAGTKKLGGQAIRAKEGPAGE